MAQLGDTIVNGALRVNGDVEATNVPFSFGVDSSGNYGYIKDGATTVTPFRHPTGTATAADVLSGKTFSSASLENTSGTMTNNGAVSKTFTPSTSSQSYTVPAGYHNGSGTVTCSAVSATKTLGSTNGTAVDMGGAYRYVNTNAVYNAGYSSGKTIVAALSTCIAGATSYTCTADATYIICASGLDSAASFTFSGSAKTLISKTNIVSGRSNFTYMIATCSSGATITISGQDTNYGMRAIFKLNTLAATFSVVTSNTTENQRPTINTTVSAGTYLGVGLYGGSSSSNHVAPAPVFANGTCIANTVYKAATSNYGYGFATIARCESSVNFNIFGNYSSGVSSGGAVLFKVAV